MNTLIRNLSERTIKEIKRQASEKDRSLQTEIKAILDETAERRRNLRNRSKNLNRIFNELKKSGKSSQTARR